MSWIPEPIDTRNVELPTALAPLTERLARNIHDVWARQRLAEGWTYGPQRDDVARRHPGLVPYESLSETERQYDRLTALETLRTIVSLGFRIEPPSVPAGPPTWAPPPAETPLASDTQRARQLLSRGMPLQALDALGWDESSDDPVRMQLSALALLRCGAAEQAQEVLVALHRAGHDDEETLGLLARTWKERAERAASAERERLLRLAGELYTRAFERTRGLWTGINAATVACRVGRVEAARTLAWAVRERALIDRGSDAYWAEATLGEAALLLDDADEACRRYARAATLARRDGRYGDLASTARQAAQLGDAGKDVHAILALLRPPRVAVCCDGVFDAAALRDADIAFVCIAVLDDASAQAADEARAAGLAVHVVGFDLDGQPAEHATRLTRGGHAGLDKRYAHWVTHGLGAQWARRLSPPGHAREVHCLDPRPADRSGLLGLLRVRTPAADTTSQLPDLLAEAGAVRIDIGEGFLLIFSDPVRAATTALQLVERVGGLRVVLHVAARSDDGDGAWDAHLVECVRLPDTPRDHVYATEAAAALLEVHDLRCDVIGRTAEGVTMAHLPRARLGS